MQVFNYHAHTAYSDGHGDFGDYLRVARSKSFLGVGFSDHAPLPWNCHWAMSEARLERYLYELQVLRASTTDLSVYAGLEVDYLPGAMGPGDERFRQASLDYLIGSVHFVDHLPDGTPWSIDGSNDIFRFGVKHIFKGSVDQAIQRYFALVREMARESRPDIIAHLDRFRRNLKDQWGEIQRTHWFWKTVNETLAVIKDAGCVLEVNTKAFYWEAHREPYPSAGILRRAIEMEIPMHLASDAHCADDLASGFVAAAKILRDLGLTHMHIYEDGQWRPLSWAEMNSHSLPS